MASILDDVSRWICFCLYTSVERDSIIFFFPSLNIIPHPLDGTHRWSAMGSLLLFLHSDLSLFLACRILMEKPAAGHSVQ
jgi:hypothetical protein